MPSAPKDAYSGAVPAVDERNFDKLFEWLDVSKEGALNLRDAQALFAVFGVEEFPSVDQFQRFSPLGRLSRQGFAELMQACVVNIGMPLEELHEAVTAERGTSTSSSSSRTKAAKPAPLSWADVSEDPDSVSSTPLDPWHWSGSAAEEDARKVSPKSMLVRPSQNPVDQESPARLLLSACWRDSLGSVYKLSSDDRAASSPSSLTVRTRRTDGRTLVTRGLIRVDKEGGVRWANSYTLDASSACRDSLRWNSDRGRPGYSWLRCNESDMVIDENTMGCEGSREHASTSRATQRAERAREHTIDESVVKTSSPFVAKPNDHSPAVPYFCVIQGDDCGINSWTWDGSHRRRWHMLVEVLFKCVIMEDEWLPDVQASLMAGADAVHVSGKIEPLMAPIVGYRPDGQPIRQSASQSFFENLLWQQRGIDRPGLRWDIDNRVRDRAVALKEKCDIILGRLGAILEQAPRDSLAFVVDSRYTDVTYEQLKIWGNGQQPRTKNVFVLLGGAHGFDGKDDPDDGLLDSIVDRLKLHLGRQSVIRVSVFDDTGVSSTCSAPHTAGFLSREYCKGGFSCAVAGAETMKWTVPNASKPREADAVAGNELRSALGLTNWGNGATVDAGRNGNRLTKVIDGSDKMAPRAILTRDGEVRTSLDKLREDRDVRTPPPKLFAKDGAAQTLAESHLAQKPPVKSPGEVSTHASDSDVRDSRDDPPSPASDQAPALPMEPSPAKLPEIVWCDICGKNRVNIGKVGRCAVSGHAACVACRVPLDDEQAPALPMEPSPAKLPEIVCCDICGKNKVNIGKAWICTFCSREQEEASPALGSTATSIQTRNKNENGGEGSNRCSKATSITVATGGHGLQTRTKSDHPVNKDSSASQGEQVQEVRVATQSIPVTEAVRQKGSSVVSRQPQEKTPSRTKPKAKPKIVVKSRTKATEEEPEPGSLEAWRMQFNECWYAGLDRAGYVGIYVLILLCVMRHFNWTLSDMCMGILIALPVIYGLVNFGKNSGLKKR